ncbi:trigger factor [Parasporobacterium paucivorans]|uniref:Trigger factor n=1 Tax=Parasporobacterium paucivorans DSM 15970 TaxID=1122934 RepID=A0A1M6KDP0_9FIRM|nr:trigger factor [Parasporobacterium paucivorans]SHJ57064.1 trigger factor [Parasporobacterium paucivorans DSM 15970]
MGLQVEKLEKNMAKLTIEVPVEKVEKAIDSAYKKQRNNMSVPGFRKGKVPRQMLEKMYGERIFFEDAANEMIPEAFESAALESGLEIVSHPDIEVVKMAKNEPFVFTAMVAVKPEVELGQYKGVEVEKTEVEVTEEEIQAELDKALEQNSRLVPVEDRAVQDSDITSIDFEGFVDGVPFDGGKGEDYSLTIGSHSFIDTFEEQLIGVKIGEEVEINVKFPEEYHSEELKGKPALFKVTVKEIKVKEIPEMDDEFASEVSEFETLEEYKADVKEKLKEKKEAEAKRTKENKVIDKLIENATIDVPDLMVQTQARQMANEFANRIVSQGISMEQYLQITGMTEDKMVDQMKPQALRTIQTSLVLEAIVEKENIEASEEEYNKELQTMAEMYKMEADKLKELISENEEKQIKTDIAVQKAIDMLCEEAVERKEA